MTFLQKHNCIITRTTRYFLFDDGVMWEIIPLANVRRLR